jgi:hypothetical protein
MSGGRDGGNIWREGEVVKNGCEGSYNNDVAIMHAKFGKKKKKSSFAYYYDDAKDNVEQQQQQQQQQLQQ